MLLKSIFRFIERHPSVEWAMSGIIIVNFIWMAIQEFRKEQYFDGALTVGLILVFLPVPPFRLSYGQPNIRTYLTLFPYGLLIALSLVRLISGLSKWMSP